MKAPLLFLVFNRPDTTARVFESIRAARPPRLFVAGDGARLDRAGEAERVAEVRRIATAVDWPCEVRTLFRDRNLGCKAAVSQGIGWFFEEVEEGVILEDDCLPHPDFFSFSEAMLERYRADDRVMAVTGNNFQDGRRRGDASYYFSAYPHIWGWATWRRAWALYDADLRFWPEFAISADWRSVCADPVERRYWTALLDRTYRGNIDTWDYQWNACMWRNRGLSVTPNVNLVSNIGFGAHATHTHSEDSPMAEMPTGALGPLTHPAEVIRDDEADRYVFDHTFGGKNLRFPQALFRAGGRVVRAVTDGLRRAMQ